MDTQTSCVLVGLISEQLIRRHKYTCIHLGKVLISKNCRDLKAEGKRRAFEFYAKPTHTHYTFMTKEEENVALAVNEAVSYREERVRVDWASLKMLSAYEISDVLCWVFKVFGSTQATKLVLAIFPLWKDLPYSKWLHVAAMLDNDELAFFWGAIPFMYKLLCMDVYECLIKENIKLNSMDQLKRIRDENESFLRCVEVVKDPMMFSERNLRRFGIEEEDARLMRKRLCLEGAVSAKYLKSSPVRNLTHLLTDLDPSAGNNN